MDVFEGALRAFVIQQHAFERARSAFERAPSAVERTRTPFDIPPPACKGPPRPLGTAAAPFAQAGGWARLPRPGKGTRIALPMWPQRGPHLGLRPPVGRRTTTRTQHVWASSGSRSQTNRLGARVSQALRGRIEHVHWWTLHSSTVENLWPQCQQFWVTVRLRMSHCTEGVKGPPAPSS